MSKIIRTVRVAGPVVTLGEVERGLYLKEDQEKGDEIVDLAALLESRIVEVRQQLETEWKQRLQRELDELQGAADQRLQEAEARWHSEREQVSQQPAS